MRIELIERASSPALFEALHDIFICTEAIGGWATLFVDGAAHFNPGDHLTVESRRGRFQVRLPLHGPMEAALSERHPDSIEINIESKMLRRTYNHTTSGLKKAMESVFHANFLQFYIKGEAALRGTVGDDWRWGSNWRFGWAIRNALAHDGSIYFSNHRKPAVQWDGLRYDHTDNGYPVFENDIGAADLILLMIDMAKELRDVVPDLKAVDLHSG